MPVDLAAVGMAVVADGHFRDPPAAQSRTFSSGIGKPRPIMMFSLLAAVLSLALAGGLVTAYFVRVSRLRAR